MSNLRRLCVLTLMAALARPAIGQITTHSLDNGTVRVGVDADVGGAIVLLSYAGRPNWVNNGIPDPGRQIQVALYRGGEVYSDCFPCPTGCAWGWNPVQGGDACGNPSGNQSVVSTPDLLQVSSQPLHWNGLLGRSNVVLQQTLRFERANVVQVDYTIQNNETFSIEGFKHELPVAYLQPLLSRAFRYVGPAPWTNALAEEVAVPVGSNALPAFTSIEPWLAWVGDDGVGLGLYVPATSLWEWRLHRLQPPGTTPTNVIQRWVEIPQAPSTQVSARAYLIAGTIAEIRAAVYDLQGRILRPTSDVSFDFDGDGKVDVGVYSSAFGAWVVRRSTDQTLYGRFFGGPGYMPVPGDYDGDGFGDLALFHPSSGLWFIEPSSGAPVYSVGFGGPEYTPTPGDYDGDGTTDIAAYHRSSGLWFVRESSSGITRSEGYGGPGYEPVPADFDGDNRTDLSVYHNASGLWFVKRTSDGVSESLGFGGPDYTPLPRDFDGDGRADRAAYHALHGLWFIRRSSDGVTSAQGYGGLGYSPVPADYDGDGKADLAAYKQLNGLFFIRPSTGGPDESLSLGGPGFVPLS